MADLPKGGPTAAKNDTIAAKAATALAAQEAPGDAPSEAAVALDFDFINLDPTDYMPHLAKHNIDPKTLDDQAVRWCETDFRVWNRRSAQGWVPVEGGKVRRGTTMLCQMPKARHTAIRKRIEQRTRELSAAPMRRLHAEADKYGGRTIEMFDGDRGPRDGL